MIARVAASGARVEAIARRELAALFLSPVAYVVIALFLLVNGWVFHYTVTVSRPLPQQIEFVVREMYSWVPFWCLVLTPFITMRLVAEEKRSGSIESLMTTPATSLDVVLGKFLAGQGFFCVIWGTLLLHVGILAVLGDVDPGPVISVNLGLFALGAAMNSMGLWASSLTRNQIVAAIISFVANLFLLLTEMLRDLLPRTAEFEQFLDYVGVMNHFRNEFLRGVVDLRFLGFYAVWVALFLFLSVRAIETRRWR